MISSFECNAKIEKIIFIQICSLLDYTVNAICNQVENYFWQNGKVLAFCYFHCAKKKNENNKIKYYVYM